jgi:ABC-2 type transport system permease protein
MSKEFKIAFKIIQKLNLNEISNPKSFFADFSIIFSRYGILMMIYWNIFQNHAQNLQDFSFNIVAWSTFFYFSTAILDYKRIFKEYESDIKSGNIETLLNKPLFYLSYRIYWRIGRRLFRYVAVTFVGLFVILSFVEIPESMRNYFFIPTMLLTLITGSLIGYLLFTLISQFAFWIEDISGIVKIVDKLIMILGGSYVPVAFFPDFIYKISIYSPFGAMFFVTHTVYDSWREKWPMMVSIQFFWVVILCILNLSVFNFLKKKVLINGG